MTYINILLITTIIVFIIDVSGFVDTVKYAVWKKYIKVGNYKNLSFKPFTCSLCMTWWTNLIYLLLAKEITLPLVAFTCLCALLASKIGDIEQYIVDTLTWLIDKLYKLISK